MSLNLPPERDVPDPGGMFASILREAEETHGDFAAPTRPQRRVSRWLLPAAAAVVAAAVTATVINLSNDNHQNVGGAPPATSVASQPMPTSGGPSQPAPSQPAPSQPAASQPATTHTPAGSPEPPPMPTVDQTWAGRPTSLRFAGGGTAHFRYFTVTVVPMQPTRPGTSVAWVKVCVAEMGPSPDAQGRTRVSSERWSSRGVAGTSTTPDAGSTYPRETTLAAGECAQGTVLWSTGAGEVTLAYENEYGEKSTWSWISMVA